MTSRDPFEVWKAERRDVARSGALAARVMDALRRSPARRATGRPARAVPFAAIAAGAILALAIQTAWIGAVLLALAGSAT